MNVRTVDITGQRFGRWTVISESEVRQNHHVAWHCKCDCGTQRVVSGSRLRDGQSASCGCGRIRDLVGRRFGKWVVVGRADDRFKNGDVKWICECDCGIERAVNRRSLIERMSKSCGCGAERLRGDKDPKWKGSRLTNGQGYVRLYNPTHPNVHADGRVLEHVAVMSEHLGRAIREGETIHHKNGIRDDNRLENLELWASKHPRGQRVEDIVQHAREMLALYENQT